MKQMATRRTRSAAKQPRTMLAEYVYSPHSPRTTVCEKGFMRDLLNVMLEVYQRARCKVSLDKGSATLLHRAATNIQIKMKINITFEIGTHSDFFTA